MGSALLNLELQDLGNGKMSITVTVDKSKLVLLALDEPDGLGTTTEIVDTPSFITKNMTWVWSRFSPGRRRNYVALPGRQLR